jgi:cyclic-di-GMP-binding biofilm dispersal mediator protein
MQGKANALVLGGSRGIGAAIVSRLARDGARVAFTYRQDAEAARRVASATGAQAIKADSSDRNALEATVSGLEPLDIAVVNAGVGLLGDPLQLDPAEVDRLIDINIRGAYHAAVCAGSHMRENGRIVLIGSMLGQAVLAPGAAAYAMTKSALQGLTRGLARDFGPRGITVNLVQPGPVDTDMNPKDGPLAASLHALMAIKRHARPDEIADLVAYLAGPSAAMITGAMLTIDGGYIA